ncbi:hypothetical protein DB88DRAFT_545777 [Papiliotrema laurentii]|uniref:Uncharacterized protein n=1 Tax=Papiliotrema laurentii TaxID=5418 RepID=A0AAD9FRL8_PAPLA|nr:hypothetical protein DB88DRAFT_545777 [Papiliotrema laurentii]
MANDWVVTELGGDPVATHQQLVMAYGRNLPSPALPPPCLVFPSPTPSNTALTKPAMRTGPRHRTRVTVPIGYQSTIATRRPHAEGQAHWAVSSSALAIGLNHPGHPCSMDAGNGRSRVALGCAAKSPTQGQKGVLRIVAPSDGEGAAILPGEPSCRPQTLLPRATTVCRRESGPASWGVPSPWEACPSHNESWGWGSAREGIVAPSMSRSCFPLNERPKLKDQSARDQGQEQLK